MPANYAHYRFGNEMLSTLSADTRRSIQRFRSLYDMGLHGPDIFFFYNILMDNPVNALGKKFHRMRGQDFFSAVCRRIRLSPSEGAQAYLYGLLTHYCLDSVCHPFVTDHSADGKIGHTELETEFDRYLLALDGHPAPEIVDTGKHMKLSKGECVTVAECYPGVRPGQVMQSVHTMAAVAKLLCTPKGNARVAMQKAAQAVANKFSPFIMGDAPNENCCHLNDALKALYDEAANRFPILREQLIAHLNRNVPLGEEFEKIFG